MAGRVGCTVEHGPSACRREPLGLWSAVAQVAALLHLAVVGVAVLVGASPGGIFATGEFLEAVLLGMSLTSGNWHSRRGLFCFVFKDAC